MTPIIYIKYHAIRTLSSPRRLVILILLLLLIAFSGLLLAFQNVPLTTYNGRVIPIIRPVESEVCIGGMVHFATITETTDDQIPGRLEIDEAWCLAGLGGACKTVTPPNPRLPLLEPKRIVTPQVSRTVPILTPGVYHFWHTATDTHGGVTGYIVAPITVKVCE